MGKVAYKKEGTAVLDLAEGTAVPSDTRTGGASIYIRNNINEIIKSKEYVINNSTWTIGATKRNK
jgi:hypothetical protein